ncbi:DUF5590 domain-containing protein [Paenibacillus filicis]|uniref:DUF5590 domain-containing protein n=1 Tax=Paenibacillus gyeongsangnamensis TaxID=3388067 RepID=A0ABT4Q7Y8_9BACL|nr:DUF5590 domain-containing protein [Paenibacillus filicis]MCZ8512988.1 DUF5590 domain-containing protein [Paenibacillus filicis]
MSKKWKWGLGFAAAIVVLVVLASRMFVAAMQDEWSADRAAVAAAYGKTILAKVHTVQRFEGDQEVTVIQGEDKIGQPLIVWVNGDNAHTEMAADGITAAQAEANVKGKQPAAQVLRTMPGLMNGQPVWEVFYKVHSDKDNRDHYFYDYYTFKDGTFIDTWRLTIQ